MIAMPLPTEGPGRRVGLDPATIVDRALAIVEVEGADALTMRRLAADLGVTTTTVYWHVGGREAVIGALLERHSRRLAAVSEVVGDTARERVMSATRRIWDSAVAHPNVTGLAHRTGASSVLNFPLHVTLARELEAAGLRGGAARDALHAIVGCVAGFLVLRLRAPAGAPPEWGSEALWSSVVDERIDPSTVLALVDPVDLERLFAPTLQAVIDRYVPE